MSTADHEIIADAARARLSSFKVPTLWLAVSDPEHVPMLATGKVDKSALQQLLRARGVPQSSFISSIRGINKQVSI